MRNRARGTRWFELRDHPFMGCVPPGVEPLEEITFRISFQNLQLNLRPPNVLCAACLDVAYRRDEPPPERLVLFCPKCGGQHVDQGEWAKRVHRTHLCEHCGELWRPRPHTTVGVTAPPGWLAERDLQRSEDGWNSFPSSTSTVVADQLDAFDKLVTKVDFDFKAAYQRTVELTNLFKRGGR